MLKNSVMDSLCQHLTENHDEDWRFEYIEHNGLALNCYLPTDSSDTYVIVDATQYDILEHGKNVPQGLIDEVIEKEFNRETYAHQLMNIYKQCHKNS